MHDLAYTSVCAHDAECTGSSEWPSNTAHRFLCLAFDRCVNRTAQHLQITRHSILKHRTPEHLISFCQDWEEMKKYSIHTMTITMTIDCSVATMEWRKEKIFPTQGRKIDRLQTQMTKNRRFTHEMSNKKDVSNIEWRETHVSEIQWPRQWCIIHKITMNAML